MEMIKYIINYTLYIAHYDAYFHINDAAKSVDILVSQISRYFIIHLNCSHIKHCQKYALPWLH